MVTRSLEGWQRGPDDDDPPPGVEDATGPVQLPAFVINAPAKGRVVLVCPDCGDQAVVDASLFARRTKDSDGTTTLTLRTRAAKIAHSCDQMTLDAVGSGPLVR